MLCWCLWSRLELQRLPNKLTAIEERLPKMAGQWQIWMIEHRETPTFSAEGLSKGHEAMSLLAPKT